MFMFHARNDVKYYTSYLMSKKCNHLQFERSGSLRTGNDRAVESMNSMLTLSVHFKTLQRNKEDFESAPLN